MSSVVSISPLLPPATAPVGLFAGRHALAELAGIPPALLDDEAYLRDLVTRAVTECGATLCDLVSKRFEPQGVTVLALLAESHASLHSYPERGSVFVDVFTCGDRADPQVAVDVLAAGLHATHVNATIVRRGLA